MHYLFSRSGQSFLALIIFVGSIVMVVGVALAYMVFTMVNSSYGYQASQAAETTAMAGVDDALLQITRNSSFSETSSTIKTGVNSATVTVANNFLSTGYATITSLATVSLRTRKIQVVISNNSSTGQMAISSWQEIQ
jgi:hypothetical protein